MSPATAFILLPLFGPGNAMAAEVVLYDFFNFGGALVTLTDSAPDLDVYNFDNDVESIRVISGTWSFHRDDNFQNGNGPPITLGPGDYPNIETLGFPADRMSSVRLIEDEPPPPEPVACAAPYLVAGDNGLCVFDCAAGTVPDPATLQCVCGNGLTETGTDDRGRRVCGPYAVAPPSQQPPLREAHWISMPGLDLDQRAYETADREVTVSTTVQTSQSLQGAALMYRAAEGPLVYDDAAKRQILAGAPWRDYRLAGVSRPLPVTFTLSAGAGDKYVYFQLRARTTDASGAVAWIESEIHVDTILYAPPGAPPPGSAGPTELRRVPAGEAFGLATANGFAFSGDTLGGTSHQCFIQRNGGALELMAKYTAFRGPGQLALPSPCSFTLFAGRDLAPGWSFDGRIELDPGVCGSGRAVFSEADRGIAVNIMVDFNFSPSLLSNCLLHGWTLATVGLRGPAGADWRDAFR